MIEEQFQEYLQKHISKLRDEVALLEQIKYEKWNTIPVRCAEISPEWFKMVLLEVENSGVLRNTAVLYYFQLVDTNKIDPIVERIRELKSGGKTKYSLPKINSTIDLPSRSILYLGKSQKNFRERLKQHCGFGSSSTFALHLLKWAKPLGLDLSLHYTIFPTTAPLHIQIQIETMMHQNMKPILGREGAMH